MTGVIIILTIIIGAIVFKTQFPFRISEVFQDSLTIIRWTEFLGKENLHFRDIQFIFISSLKGKNAVIFIKKADQELLEIRPKEMIFKELEIFCSRNDIPLAEYEEFMGNINIINQSENRPETAFKIN